MHPNLILSLIVLFGLVATVEGLSCIGDNEQEVDWYIAYKLPGKEDPDFNGYGYVYMDSKSNGFQLSKEPTYDTHSCMGATLQPVYNGVKNQRDDLAYIFYNDHSPKGKEYSSNGHSKGVVAFTTNSGFWLIDSVPQYPPYIRDNYTYPETGSIYGQMFLCVSFDVSQFDAIGKQLRFIGPRIHDSKLPNQMAQSVPNIKSLLQDKVIHGQPYKNVVKLTSKSGKSFIHFAKNKKFGEDLYSEFVAPELKSNLLTETWQRGKKVHDPLCQGYTVEDVSSIKILNTYEFESSQDHSKFAFSKSDNHYVCVGDINRMTSQFKRGGGTMCIDNEYIWDHFRKLVGSYVKCEQQKDQYQHNEF